MDQESKSEPAEHGGTAGPQGATASPAIDIQRLADRVYALMRAEIRLSLARGERDGLQRKR